MSFRELYIMYFIHNLYHLQLARVHKDLYNCFKNHFIQVFIINFVSYADLYTKFSLTQNYRNIVQRINISITKKANEFGSSC